MERMEIRSENRRKLLNQWFLSITKFSDDLIQDLETLKNWPENVKTMQKNWIGVTGAEIDFYLTKECRLDE